MANHPSLHYDFRIPPPRNAVPRGMYNNSGESMHGRKKIVDNLKENLVQINTKPMFLSQNIVQAPRPGTPRPVSRRPFGTNVLPLELSSNSSNRHFFDMTGQHLGNGSRTFEHDREAPVVATSIDLQTERIIHQGDIDLYTQHNRNELQVERATIGDSNPPDCGADGQSRSHPIEYFAGWTLQDIEIFAKYSPKAEASGVKDVLKLHTLQEMINHYNSSPRNDGNNSVITDNSTAQEKSDFSNVFTRSTLRDFVESLGAKNQDQQQLCGKNPDISHLFDPFADCTINQIIDRLSAKEFSGNASQIGIQEQLTTEEVTRYKLKEDFNESSNFHYFHRLNQEQYPTEQQVPTRLMGAENFSNKRSNFNNSHRPLRRTDSVMTPLHPIDPLTEMSRVTENYSAKSITKPKTAPTNQLFKEGDEYGTRRRSAREFLPEGKQNSINQIVGYSKYHLRNQKFWSTKSKLTLSSSDIAAMDRNQFQNLASNYTIEIYSDFCRILGHSDICPYKSLCKFLHNTMCKICGLYCISKTKPFAYVHHAEECQMKLYLERLQELVGMRPMKNNAEACELCKKIVPTNASIFDKQYGILSNCDHVFCLECAEKSRMDTGDGERQKILICRICGVRSAFYAASTRLLKKEEKKEFLVNYVESMKTLKCKYCTEDSNSEVREGLGICYHGRAIPNHNSMFKL